MGVNYTSSWLKNLFLSFFFFWVGGKRTAGVKWLYKIKRTVDGENYRYKVMLLSKGYTQKYAQLDIAGMLISLATHHK